MKEKERERERFMRPVLPAVGQLKQGTGLVYECTTEYYGVVLDMKI